MKLYVPTIDQGSWQNCQWTGQALRKCADQSISMLLTRDAEQRIIPAMPRNPFTFRSKLIGMFFNISDNEGNLLYDSCIVTTSRTKSVPLKPKTKNMPNRRHREALEQGYDKLTNMYPGAIMPDNIGSNVGLLRIIRRHFERENQHLKDRCKRYSAFNVDCNIFDRMLKVREICVCERGNMGAQGETGREQR